MTEAPTEPTVSVEESVLATIKQMLDIEDEYTEYDTNVKLLINSSFSTLQQIGVPKFRITDRSTKWSELTPDETIRDWVAEFIFHRVKRAFDPPQTGFHNTAIKEQLDELAFRINTYEEGTTWVLLATPLP